MDEKVSNIAVFLITQDSEMRLASDVLLLRYYLANEVKIKPNIVIFDNGSKDRTHELARELKLEVFRSKRKRIKQELVKKLLRVGGDRDVGTLIILDLQSGNTADDAISLISRSLMEKSRFASAYIRPIRGRSGIGCWAIDRGILKQMGSDPETDIKEKILELASKEDLELWAVSEEVSFQSKKTRRNLFELFKRSPIEVLSGLIRYHPLLFYGISGLLVLSLAILSGFYTVDYFYKHNQLNYFPAFITMALIMIGGFLMVAGLILNAWNVLIERLNAVSKWKG
ncbi:MAG: hypothetical protein DRN57_08630 [Thermoplasmata archaeon]|nr:MAG: hypothetical protein DRN57_08630 [Thermoplasmata archaeon]